MDTKTTISRNKRTNGENCIHYWRIETPNGGICKGLCRLCGEEKKFISSWEGLVSMKNEQKPVDKASSIEDRTSPD